MSEKKTMPGQGLKKTHLLCAQEARILRVAFFQTTKNRLYELTSEYLVA